MRQVTWKWKVLGKFRNKLYLMLREQQPSKSWFTWVLLRKIKYRRNINFALNTKKNWKSVKSAKFCKKKFYKKLQNHWKAGKKMEMKELFTAKANKQPNHCKKWKTGFVSFFVNFSTRQKVGWGYFYLISMCNNFFSLLLL